MQHILSVFRVRLHSVWEKRDLSKLKVEVKQSFDSLDAIKFEAALTANGIETKYKQKQYVA